VLIAFRSLWAEPFCEVETPIGRRTVVERILRNGEDIEVQSDYDFAVP
jgi:hypothetical protein